MNQQFDFIVVGGGSAGAVLASRLSEDPKSRVCLVEAGKKDSNPLIHVPFGLSLLSRFDSLGWGFYTSPQSYLNDRELFWPRGKTLGGSSSVNAMCYVRGQPQDYDNWALQGAAGWGFKDVLPWFKKAEDFFAGSDDYHGVGGPLRVEALRYTSALSHRFVDAASYVYLPRRHDFNRDEREGLGFYHVTQRNGKRWSTASAYLRKALGRSNLTVMTNVMAERILFNQGRAHGIQIRINGKGARIHARKEVILCGGAINSPHLLLLSGVGPANVLHDKGIHVQVDAPGVGQNLQDHLDAIVQYDCRNHDGYGIALSAVPAYIKAAWQYFSGHRGLLASNIAEAGGFARSSTQLRFPDLQFHFLPAKLSDHGRHSVYGYGFGIHVCCLYPKSRGSLTLQSNHPSDHLRIDPNYLSHPDDLAVLVRGVKLARRIAHSPAFGGVNGKEILPGENCVTSESIESFIREHAETIYHPVGTCKMGAKDDPMAVVDSQLRVKGVEGLRVVDASVIPSLIGGNTNAPTVMIAERGAEFIRRDHG